VTPNSSQALLVFGLVTGPKGFRISRCASSITNLAEVTVDDLSGMIRWSDWHPLQGSSRNTAIPATPGLYRARVAQTGEVVYVGQTGRNLRARLGMLCTCHDKDMPYRDPHTAAPTLWALRDRDRIEFEVSTSRLISTKVERLALEAVAITAHRVQHGASPLANFGGGIAGYRLSSSNNSALVSAGKRFRGGPDPLVKASRSVAVPGPIFSEVTTSDWLGLSWSPWEPFVAAKCGPLSGLYRIRRAFEADLVYVGQGRIRNRLRAHLAKASQPENRQAPYFTGATEVSWVVLDTERRSLLELENDAIASHRFMRGFAPLAQFIG
jgi:hypothetical protein